ncbi:MAG: hypothetical protein IKE95_09810, partial [Methanobrevibacter sp.]|nr:hypothetical protein [Methanobrevibacter sp.]
EYFNHEKGTFPFFCSVQVNVKFGCAFKAKFNIYLNGAEEGECPFFMIKIFDKTKIGEGKGIFTNPNVFDVDSNEVDEFDKKFDYKEKKVTEGQLE